MKTKQRYHPKVMKHLMRQAQEEDLRREMMAEMDREALQHLSRSLRSNTT